MLFYTRGCFHEKQAIIPLMEPFFCATGGSGWPRYGQNGKPPTSNGTPARFREESSLNPGVPAWKGGKRKEGGGGIEPGMSAARG